MQMYDANGNPVQDQTDGVTKTANVEETKIQVDKNIQPETNRRKCPLSDTIIKLLVQQLNHELTNHSLYKTFSNYFATCGLVDLEEYYEKRAHEELRHHSWIAKYLNNNDAEVQYPPADPINVVIEDKMQPFDLTVDKEIETTMKINVIVEQALKEKDWATFAWLTSDDDENGRLVMEQIEEETTSRTARDIAKGDSPWLQKADAILDLLEN